MVSGNLSSRGPERTTIHHSLFAIQNSRNSPIRPSVNREIPQSLNRRIAQSTGIVMASVLASRVLGFMREWLVAHQIGSNAITDAYYAAFTLPDFLNYLVAGGPLRITFIPVFAKFAAENKEEEIGRAHV